VREVRVLLPGGRERQGLAGSPASPEAGVRGGDEWVSESFGLGRWIAAAVLAVADVPEPWVGLVS
jgi:hypothetical protein